MTSNDTREPEKNWFVWYEEYISREYASNNSYGMPQEPKNIIIRFVTEQEAIDEANRLIKLGKHVSILRREHVVQLILVPK